MLWLLALALLSAATLGSVRAYQRGMAERLEAGPRRRALPPGPQEPTTERTLQTLRVGDVVVDGAEDWLIVGTSTYREEGEVWWVHQVDDGQRRRLLEVRDRGGWTVTMLDPADDVPTFGQLGRGITFRQQPYQLARRGDAKVSTDGHVATTAGILQYATYHGPGGAYLNLEDKDGARRAFAGATVEATGLMLMPGQPLEDDALGEL